MIVVIVLGIPYERYNSPELRELVRTIEKEIKRHPSIPNEIAVFMPTDALSKGLGEELVVYIDVPMEGQAPKALVATIVGNALTEFAADFVPNCDTVAVLSISGSSRNELFTWDSLPAA